MNRLVLACTASLGASLVVAPASAQTLSWSTFTESMRPTAQEPLGDHGEHARPASWLPFFTAGQFDLRVIVDYDVSVTSTRPTPLIADLEMELSDAFVTNNVCWGIDPTSPSRYFIFGETVPGNSTVRYTGSVLLHSITVNFFGCPPGTGSDTVHVGPGPSFVSAGPMAASVPSGDWLTDPFSPAGLFLSIVDEGSVIRNELEFETVHDLPLVAGSTGCDPLQPNSTGAFGSLEAYGVASTTESSLVLNATDMPRASFCLIAVSRTAQAPAMTSFGVSTLCLASPAYRWLNTVGQTDSAGAYQLVLDPSVLPPQLGPIMPGDSLFFQLFHRDTVPATGSASANSTNAIQLTF